jgi:hypothetical protein
MLLLMLTYVGFLFEALEGVGEEFGVAGGEVDGLFRGCHVGVLVGSYSGNGGFV